MKSTGLVFSSRNYIGSAEPPATVLEDESRFGNDGAFKGDGEPDWVQLSSGLWVMSFDGNDDTCDFSARLWGIANNWTIRFWVSPTNTTTQYRALSFTSGATQSDIRVILNQNANTELRVLLYGNAAGVKDYRANIITASWQSLGLTYDGTTLSGYYNGSAITFTKTIDDAVDMVNRSRSMEMGYYTTTFLSGYMGLPEICSYPYSAGQSKQKFEAERHWFGV